MLPVDFPGRNIIFTKPEGWKDEDCGDLPAHMSTDEQGNPRTIIAMKPSKEDLEALNRGEALYIVLHIQGMIPIAAYTFDENGKVNA